MARSIPNSPQGQGVDVIGLVGAFIQAKQARAKENAATASAQHDQLDKLMEGMQDLPESEQRKKMDLTLRLPDKMIEARYGLSREGMEELLRPTQTVRGGEGSVMFPGSTTTSRFNTAQADAAKAAATTATVAAKQATRQEAGAPGRAVIEHQKAYVNLDGSKLTSDEARGIAEGTASPELLANVRSTTPMDDLRRQTRIAATALGMDPDYLEARVIATDYVNPIRTKEIAMALDEQRFDDIPNVVTLSDLEVLLKRKQLLSIDLLNTQRLKELNSMSGAKITAGQIIDVKKTLAQIPTLALAKLNPLFDPVLTEGDNFQVQDIDSATGKVARTPLSKFGWIYWGGNPVEARGATPDDKQFFEPDAIQALVAPWDQGSTGAIAKYGLDTPSIFELGNAQAAEALLSSYERWLGYRMIRLDGIPTGKADVKQPLTRNQLKIMMIQAHKQGGTAIKILQDFAVANPNPPGTETRTGAIDRFDPTDAGAPAEPESDLPQSLQILLDEIGSSLGSDRDAQIEQELELLRNPPTSPTNPTP